MILGKLVIHIIGNRLVIHIVGNGLVIHIVGHETRGNAAVSGDNLSKEKLKRKQLTWH